MYVCMYVHTYIPVFIVDRFVLYSALFARLITNRVKGRELPNTYHRNIGW